MGAVNLQCTKNTKQLCPLEKLFSFSYPVNAKISGCYNEFNKDNLLVYGRSSQLAVFQHQNHTLVVHPKVIGADIKVAVSELVSVSTDTDILSYKSQLKEHWVLEADTVGKPLLQVMAGRRGNNALILARTSTGVILFNASSDHTMGRLMHQSDNDKFGYKTTDATLNAFDPCVFGIAFDNSVVKVYNAEDNQPMWQCQIPKMEYEKPHWSSCAFSKDHMMLLYVSNGRGVYQLDLRDGGSQQNCIPVLESHQVLDLTTMTDPCMQLDTSKVGPFLYSLSSHTVFMTDLRRSKRTYMRWEHMLPETPFDILLASPSVNTEFCFLPDRKNSMCCISRTDISTGLPKVFHLMGDTITYAHDRGFWFTEASTDRAQSMCMGVSAICADNGKNVEYFSLNQFGDIFQQRFFYDAGDAKSVSNMDDIKFAESLLEKLENKGNLEQANFVHSNHNLDTNLDIEICRMPLAELCIMENQANVVKHKTDNETEVTHVTSWNVIKSVRKLCKSSRKTRASNGSNDDIFNCPNPTFKLLCEQFCFDKKMDDVEMDRQAGSLSGLINTDSFKKKEAELRSGPLLLQFKNLPIPFPIESILNLFEPNEDVVEENVDGNIVHPIVIKEELNDVDEALSNTQKFVPLSQVLTDHSTPRGSSYFGSMMKRNSLGSSKKKTHKKMFS